jgi:hypothetical protein
MSSFARWMSGVRAGAALADGAFEVAGDVHPAVATASAKATTTPRRKATVAVSPRA